MGVGGAHSQCEAWRGSQPDSFQIRGPAGEPAARGAGAGGRGPSSTQPSAGPSEHGRDTLGSVPSSLDLGSWAFAPRVLSGVHGGLRASCHLFS